jgi:hypothetical protein
MAPRRVIRDEGHVVALERAAMAAFSCERPCTHKTADPTRTPDRCGLMMSAGRVLAAAIRLR